VPAARETQAVALPKQTEMAVLRVMRPALLGFLALLLLARLGRLGLPVLPVAQSGRGLMGW